MTDRSKLDKVTWLIKYQISNQNFAVYNVHVSRIAEMVFSRVHLSKAVFASNNADG